MRKLISNLSIRAKIMLITTPLTCAIIFSTIVSGIIANRAKNEAETIYYDTLYAINNNLVSADRDFYQALVGASQHRELSGEAPVKPEGNPGTDFSAQMKEKLNDFEENKSQVLNKVKDAADIASKFDILYNQLKSDSGYTFSQLVNLFNSGYDEWVALYDVGNGRVDWTSFNDKFNTLRDYLDKMQEITEEFAVIEEEEISKSINNQVMAISIVFGL
nr:hypothetical protein [Lachnospiraceae bacterium]